MKKVKTIPKLMYEIRPSRALPGQVATFAVRRIRRGEVVADVDSPEEAVILSERDYRRLDRLTRAKVKNFCVLEDGEYIVPADLNNLGASWYFNHSCAPNVGYDRQGNFVALRDIRRDEELFLDYGWMFTDPRFKMKCSCGAPDCRGVVTGRDWLDPDFRDKNQDKMWPEMRKRPRSGKTRPTG
ncbi:MAG: SET domain-containing protein-lysine N-methyltransferase [Patescibacteria group bacterium]